MKLESRSEKLASAAVYRKRLIQSGAVGSIMVVVSLAVGMGGMRSSRTSSGWMRS